MAVSDVAATESRTLQVMMVAVPTFSAHAAIPRRSAYSSAVTFLDRRW